MAFIILLPIFETMFTKVSNFKLAELTDLYQMMRSIEETLRDARRLIGWSDAMTVYEAGDRIISNQRAITEKRKGKGGQSDATA